MSQLKVFSIKSYVIFEPPLLLKVTKLWILVKVEPITKEYERILYLLEELCLIVAFAGKTLFILATKLWTVKSKDTSLQISCNNSL